MPVWTAHVLMAALTYNLKKYLKWVNKAYAANSIVLVAVKRTITEKNNPYILVFIFLMIIFRFLKKNGFENSEFL